MRFAEASNVFLQPSPNRFNSALLPGYTPALPADTVLTTEDGKKFVTENGQAFIETENSP